jgi:CubicO group peptidase (beta-lactamase class C family)
MTMLPRLAALLAEGLGTHYAGAAAGIANSTGVLETAFVGDARLEPAPDRCAASARTLWDLASLTKPLAGAALILRLAEDRSLGLDDPVGRFDDLFKATRFYGTTLRHLLAHTSGMADWFPCYVRGEGRGAYRKTLAGLDLAARPGTTVTYSCLGYLVLADVVERVAGVPLDHLFAERVALPTGLQADLLFSPEGPDLLRCAGGERDDETERRKTALLGLRYAGFRTGVVNGEVNDGNAFRRAGGVSLNAGLFGTLGAVLEMGRAWLTRDERLLQDGSYAEAIRVQTGDLEGPRGLGWQMATEENGGGPATAPGAFGHTGFTGVSLFVDPRRDRVHVLLANRLHPDARGVDMNALRRRLHAVEPD